MALPQALNALNSGLIKDICTAAEAFEANPDVAALVLTGSERAFAGKRAHHDLDHAQLHTSDRS